MSPEMCLGDSGFVALLEDSRWSRSILFMVVDEAHCIKRWGGEFREHYASLETLHPFVPRGAPVLVTSATMPPMTLEGGGVTSVCSAWISCGVIGVFVLSTAFFKNSSFVFGCWWSVSCRGMQRDEDGHWSFAVKTVGIVSCVSVRDSKLSIEINMGSTEIRRFDTTCQIVHLAPSDLLNGGKGPLLG